jgi:hypothetical protein
MFVSQIIDEVLDILGTTDKPKAYRKLTQAVQILMQSGHWFHTNAEVDVCTGWDNQTITLPRNIEVPLGVNVDGSPTYFRGRLFQYHVNKGGMYNPVGWAWDDRGMVATQMDIRQPAQLVAVAEHEADAGKIIRVIGTDSSNRDLRSQMDDGTGVDGLLVPIHAQSDFPYGTIQPDGVTITTRTSAIEPLTNFESGEAHGLTSGPSATLEILTGETPVDLFSGSEYYIGVVDDTTIQLHQSELDATYGNNPIKLQSILGTEPNSIRLTDSRQAQLQTVVNLGAQPSITIDSPNEVNFYKTNESTPLPSPLKENVVYYVNALDLYNLQVYANRVDAQNRTNPILLSGNNAAFKVGIRKAMTAQTKLTFTSASGFYAGDSVEAYTNGGVLPQPLVVGQSYYVGTVDGDPLSITLHSTYADAIAKTNSINFVTAGSGSFSVAKLIPATAIAGVENNISAVGFNLPTATGAGATLSPQVVGPVTSAAITNGGTAYSSATASFSDAGGYNYISVPSVEVAGGAYTTKATAHAVLATDPATSLQYVSQVVIDSAGTGYDPVNPPKIVFSGGLAASGFEASASVTISGGGVSAITLNTVGSGVAANVLVNTISRTVNGILLTSPGAGYMYPPRITLSAPQPEAGVFTGSIAANSKQLVVTSLQSGTISVGATISGTNVVSGTKINGFVSGTNGGVGTYTIDTENTVASTTINSTAVPGTQATASCAVTTSFIKAIKVTNGGSGYTNVPAIAITGGQGTGAVATAVINGGAVTSVIMVAQGTGYTSQPTATVKPSTGVFVQFSSTGTLPQPLEQGNSYRAESPSSANTFTVRNVDYSEVNITSTGSGNFYLVVSRTFGIGFTNKWVGDFAGLATGSQISLQTDYQLPITNPATGPGSLGYLSKISDTEAYLYQQSNLTTLYQVQQIGVGQSYLSYSLNGTPVVYEDTIQLDSSVYLSVGQKVRFASSGTLPSPLSGDTDYTIYSITGNGVVVSIGQSPITFTSLGVGQLVLNVVRDFTVLPSLSIVCNNSLIETGNQLTVRPAQGDSLPFPLMASTYSTPHVYFARRSGSQNFELYDTLAHAQNTSSTVGRVEFETTGDSISSTFFTDLVTSQTLVKAVRHVEKPVTVGYVSLYAFDYGRSNDMALIGQYHPSETNPKYRRIRIGKPCAWARIIYRVKAPEITSIYDYIPIENTRAVVAAVHAVDLEDKDFMEQSQKYWQAALMYLKNENDSMDGHAMMPPQINNETYGDGTDCVMF